MPEWSVGLRRAIGQRFRPTNHSPADISEISLYHWPKAGQDRMEQERGKRKSIRLKLGQTDQKKDGWR